MLAFTASNPLLPIPEELSGAVVSVVAAADGAAVFGFRMPTAAGAASAAELHVNPVIELISPSAKSYEITLTRRSVQSYVELCISPSKNPVSILS